jgi:hypothetical protein
MLAGISDEQRKIGLGGSRDISGDLSDFPAFTTVSFLLAMILRHQMMIHKYDHVIFSWTNHQ